MNYRDIQFTIGDAITSLMYASSINVILSKSVEKITSSSFYAILMILFIFIDWLSRIGVPNTFPQSDQDRRELFWIQLIKAAFEIMGVFLLVSICMLFFSQKGGVDNDCLAAHRIFGLFLITTFLWNAIILYVMVDLRWVDLIKGGLNGGVFDLKGINTYTNHFKDKVSLSKEVATRQTQTDGESVMNNLCHIFNVVIECFGRSIAQSLANHIAWVPLVVGGLLFSELFNNFVIENIGILCRALLILGVFFIPTLFYFIAYWLKGALIIKYLKWVAGGAAVVCLLIFYATFHIENIIYVIAAQQVLTGLFLQFATMKNGENGGQKVSPANGVTGLVLQSVATGNEEQELKHIEEGV